MEVLTCKHLDISTQFYPQAAKVAYHGRRWYVQVASAFPLAPHYRALFGRRARICKMFDSVAGGEVRSETGK
jgi:hypothetical protein